MSSRRSFSALSVFTVAVLAMCVVYLVVVGDDGAINMDNQLSSDDNSSEPTAATTQSSSSTTSTKVSKTTKKAAAISKGIFRGFFKKSIGDLTECAEGESHMVTEFEEAYDDLTTKKHNTIQFLKSVLKFPQYATCHMVPASMRKNMDCSRDKVKKRIKNGLDHLGEGMTAAYNVYEACKASEADLKKYRKAAKAYTSPESIAIKVGEDIIMNGQSIIDLVDDATKNYKKKNWEDFGKNLGSLLYLIFVG